MVWQATKGSKIRSISASHNLEYSSRKTPIGAVHLLSRGKESGNFAIFGQGKPGKVREFHSAEVLTTMITEKIRASLDEDKVACGIFIDLQKAFDTVNHDILLKKFRLSTYTSNSCILSALF